MAGIIIDGAADLRSSGSDVRKTAADNRSVDGFMQRRNVSRFLFDETSKTGTRLCIFAELFYRKRRYNVYAAGERAVSIIQQNNDSRAAKVNADYTHGKAEYEITAKGAPLKTGQGHGTG